MSEHNLRPLTISGAKSRKQASFFVSLSFYYVPDKSNCYMPCIRIQITVGQKSRDNGFHSALPASLNSRQTLAFSGTDQAVTGHTHIGIRVQSLGGAGLAACNINLWHMEPGCNTPLIGDDMWSWRKADMVLVESMTT